MKRVKMVVLIGLAALGAVYARTRPEDMTREQKNKLLVEVAIGAMNAGDFEAIKELYSPKFVQHQPGNQKKINWTGFELGCRLIHSTIPTWRYEIEDSIAEGDKVVVRGKTVITYQQGYGGRLRGAGKVELSEIDIFRIEGGRIVEEWCEADYSQWERKIGNLKYVTKWK